MFVPVIRNMSYGMKILSSNGSIQIQKRGIWAWLNSVFNQVDVDRVMKGGPDRACAEWLLRCGAKYRWIESEKWISDYNSLPANNHPVHKIKEVDATNSCIDSDGFEHFKNCNFIERVRLNEADYVDDLAISKLKFLKKSLKHLEITSCGDVSEKGLKTLHRLTKLETLYLFDLPLVDDEETVLQELGKSLPQCEISFRRK